MDGETEGTRAEAFGTWQAGTSLAGKQNVLSAAPPLPLPPGIECAHRIVDDLRCGVDRLSAKRRVRRSVTKTALPWSSSRISGHLVGLCRGVLAVSTEPPERSLHRPVDDSKPL